MARSKIMIQMGMAIGLALIAGFLVYKWMVGASKANQAQATPKIESYAVVATRDLRRGVKLTAEHLKKVPYFKESLPKDSFTEISQVEGRVLFLPVMENEPLTQSRLASENVDSAGIGVMITPGKRALAVKGNKVLGLAGFIKPGNHVDVLVTIEHEDIASKMATKTVLENILVLATGTELEDRGDGEEPAPVDTYTLELFPEEAEKMALAATKGTLHFALRNPTDSTSIITSGASVLDTLSSLKAAEPPAKKAKAAPKRVVRVVEIIKGSSLEKVNF